MKTLTITNRAETARGKRGRKGRRRRIKKTPVWHN